MWCGRCQSDVVTELAADNRRVVCATCGTALGEAAVSQTEPANQRNSRAQEARELLNRWANSRSFDPFGPPRKRVFEDALQPPVVPVSTQVATAIETPPLIAESVPAPVAESIPASPAMSSLVESRVADSPMNADLDRLTNEILARVEKISRDTNTSLKAVNDIPTPASIVAPTGADSVGPPAAMMGLTAPMVEQTGDSLTTPMARHTDSAPMPEVEPPVVLPSPALSQLTSSPSSASPSLWVATARKNLGLMGHIGQGLSYSGILGITLGLSLVVLGTFGASSQLAPTGWLIATLGQMLLLLGVVTSVSVGMEQSSAEMRALVDERMRLLSEQMEQLRREPTRVDQAHETTLAPRFTMVPQRDSIEVP